jgi:hypothetical protein
MIIEVEAPQLGALNTDHLDAAEVVAMKVGKLRQALGLCDAVFAAMRFKEIGDVMLAAAAHDNEVRKERPPLPLKFVRNPE